MSSLYTRANSRQARILRIVEGACHNAAHAHPGKVMDARFARSISKRAAGTMTAAWPDLLATPMALSEKPRGTLLARGERVDRDTSARRSGQIIVSLAAPVRKLHISVGNLASAAKKAGHNSRYTAFVEVLREIGAVLKSLEAQS